MTKLEMIELIAIITVGVGIGIYYLIKAIRGNWVKALKGTIEDSIAEAERTNRKGEDKKNLVLGRIQAKCQELGIPYDMIKKLVGKLIDQIVANYNVIEKGR